jgi:hypothetical protein
MRFLLENQNLWLRGGAWRVEGAATQQGFSTEQPALLRVALAPYRDDRQGRRRFVCSFAAAP